MGLQYDDTPSEKWMAAKVYAEYGIRLVNDFIRQHGKMDIPMPIARSFGRNLERAIEHLPEESTWGDQFMEAKQGLEATIAPMRDVATLTNGQLSGTLPVAMLAKALGVVKDLFAHAYAESTHEARFDMLEASNETTDEGFVGEWDSDTYDSPEEDPEAEITSWDEAKEQIYDENHGMGLDWWKSNETEIFASLYFSGPYSGHGGGPQGPEQRTVKTEFALLDGPTKERK
jgi:hypothetical protein